MTVTPELLAKRYNDAESRAQYWYQQLQMTYDLCMPNRSRFVRREMTPGQPMTQHVYDATAPVAIVKYSDYICANLMPMGENWCQITSSVAESDQTSDQKAALEYYTNTLFDALNRSNFYRAIHSSIAESAISTGVLLIREGKDKSHPFSFTSVPLFEVYLGGDESTSDITDVFRTLKNVEARFIQKTWPGAKLSSAMENSIANNANTKFNLVEGTVWLPEQPEGKQYCYYVQCSETKHLLIEEYRSYSPWVVFRQNAYSSELYGRGTALDLLPTIRSLNRLAEDQLRLNTFQSHPIIMNAGANLNPYTSVFQSGGIINVDNPQQMAQLQIQGRLDASQLSRQTLQQEVMTAFGVSEMTPEMAAKSTATGAEMIESQRMVTNQGLAARLQYELCHQLIEKLFHICSRLGMWKTTKIDNNKLRLSFVAPVNQTQKMKNISKLKRYTQDMQELAGPQMATQAIALGINVQEVPSYVAGELNIPVELQRSEIQRQQLIKAAVTPPQAPPQAPQTSVIPGAQNNEQESGQQGLGQ